MRSHAPGCRGGATALVAVLSVLALLGPASFVRAKEWSQLSWVSQYGSPADDSPGPLAIADGDLVFAGSTWGLLPGQTSSGLPDAYVGSTSTDGTIRWIRQFGTSEVDEAFAVAGHTTGVYVAGGTDGILAPGPYVDGTWDGFVSRYGLDGDPIWTRQLGTSRGEEVEAIAVDDSGVYVVGVTDGAFPDRNSAGSTDAFVVKFTFEGEVAWLVQFGTEEWDQANGIAADATGIYVAGETAGTFSGEQPFGWTDAFLRKIDASGNEVWTRQFGTAGEDRAMGVAVDATGVYLTGGLGGAGGTAPGAMDGFVSKYDRDGLQLWIHRFGTPDRDEMHAAAAGGGLLVVAGHTGGTFAGQENAGAWDALVRAFTPGGDALWSLQFGSIGGDMARGVVADDTGVYVGGNTCAPLPGEKEEGHCDGFIAEVAPGSDASSFGSPGGGPVGGLLLLAVAVASVAVLGISVRSLRLRRHR